MEKIPYKPGDVLVDKFGNQRMVIDLSNNKEVVFLDNNGSSLAITYTKEMLDISGYTLKTPKEELCIHKIPYCDVCIGTEMIKTVQSLQKTPKEDVCKNCNEHPCRKCLNKIIPGCIVCVCHYQTPTPWRPERGEEYFYISDCGDIFYSYNNSEFHKEIDEYRIKSGNCFRTREEAEEKLKEIMGREI